MQAYSHHSPAAAAEIDRPGSRFAALALGLLAAAVAASFIAGLVVGARDWQYSRPPRMDAAVSRPSLRPAPGETFTIYLVADEATRLLLERALGGAATPPPHMVIEARDAASEARAFETFVELNGFRSALDLPEVRLADLRPR